MPPQKHVLSKKKKKKKLCNVLGQGTQTLAVPVHQADMICTWLLGAPYTILSALVQVELCVLTPGMSR